MCFIMRVEEVKLRATKISLEADAIGRRSSARLEVMSLTGGP